MVILGLRQYLLDHTAHRLDVALIVGFIRHTLQLPLSFFESRYVGDIISRVQENRKIERFLSGEALSILLDLLTVFIYVGLMFWYSWKMAFLALVIVPPFALLALIATPFLQKISREIFSAYAKESSYLIEAAKLAGADEFIKKLPMGYETQIGEGGGLLSGGQRQRIAIARALLGNPKLLVLDEATSHLDTESERIIQRNFNTILKGKTTLVIAHRLSTVRNADLILVLDKGVLIESGTHDELMSKRGHFFYLNRQQGVMSNE